jgi:hypothetical protein
MVINVIDGRDMKLVSGFVVTKKLSFYKLHLIPCRRCCLETDT